MNWRNSIEQILKFRITNIMAPHIRMLALLLVFGSIVAWNDDRIVKYSALVFIFITLCHALNMISYFKKNDPDRLHNEDHIQSMTLLGQKNPRVDAIESSTPINAFRQLEASVKGGAIGTTTNSENSNSGENDSE